MAGEGDCPNEPPGKRKVHRSTLSRRQLKVADPIKYQDYLDKQKQRSRKQREKLKKELSKKNPPIMALKHKQRLLENQRKRQAKYMAKRKLSQDLPHPHRSKHVKCATRKYIEEKRNYNRVMKQKSRSLMSSQKKNWIKKKDRERKRMKRMKTVTNLKTELTSDIMVEKLHMVPEGKQALKDLAHHLNKEGFSQSFLSRKFCINRRTIRRLKTTKERLQRKTRINVKKIKSFYQRSDISRIVPQRRYATKDGPGFLLLTSLKDAHAKYQQENKDSTVSFSTFAALRPRNVRLLSKTHREYCMCSYCMNVRNKLLTLESAISSKGVNENNLLDVLLCPKASTERFHKPECIMGKCHSCSSYRKTLDERYSSVPEERQLTWTRWERLDGRMELITKSGNKVKLLKEFVEYDILKPCQGTTFFQHIHTANWQQHQFTVIKNSLPDNWCLQVMDFAKNRGIMHQEEAKSAFFNNSQITIHPIVSYYKNGKSDFIRESSIIISEDPLHDYHSVQHYKSIVSEHIEQQLGRVPEKFIVFSDGCAAQYKSKGPFADLSLDKVVTSRNYFGSEHGKSECDGETGILNRAVDRAIIGKKVVVTNAEDLYNYCSNFLTLDDALSKRNFFLVKRGDFTRERPSTKVRPVKKTRTFHTVENTGTAYQIKTRNLSCFCHQCLTGNTSGCLNSQYVEEFNYQKLIKEGVPESNNVIKGDRKESKRETSKIKERTPKEMSDCLHNQMQACQNYEELEAWASELQILPIADQPDISLVSHTRTVDRASMSLLPYDDDNLINLYPTLIYGDGNCLPRCGSLFAYGTEEKHSEIRTRIVVELVKNKKKYTEMPSARDFAMYSDQYLDEHLTLSAIEHIFEKEILSIRKSGTYMGAWQIAALADVLQRPVRSVYPVHGGHTVRKHLDRLFLPSLAKHSQVHIMWTNIHGNNIPQNQWRPNHFVCMIPLAPRATEVVIETGPESSSYLHGQEEYPDSKCDDMDFADSSDLWKEDLNISSLLSDLEYDTLAFDGPADTVKGNLNLSSLISDLECDTVDRNDPADDPVSTRVVEGTETQTPPESTVTVNLLQKLFKVQKRRNAVLLGYGFNIMNKGGICGL